MSMQKKKGTVRVVEGWVMYQICKSDPYSLCRYRIPVDANWTDDDSMVPCGKSDKELLQFFNNNEYINDLLSGLDESIDWHLIGCEDFRAIGFDKVLDSKFVGIMGIPKEHESFDSEFDAIKSVCDVTLKEVA
jgi:hypothetical protein